MTGTADQDAAAIERVRRVLSDIRGEVARFRDKHDPACDCDWDRGAMHVVEAVDTAIGQEVQQ